MGYSLAYVLAGFVFTFFLVIRVRRNGKLLTVMVSDVAALIGVVLLWPFAALAMLWWSVHDIVIIGGKSND